MSSAGAEKRSAVLPTGPRHDPEGYLFEVAWEVCQQLGGIYTVIRSKIPSMIEHWGERYCLIGPYNPATAAIEFDEAEPPELLRPALQKLHPSVASTVSIRSTSTRTDCRPTESLFPASLRSSAEATTMSAVGSSNSEEPNTT